MKRKFKYIFHIIKSKTVHGDYKDNMNNISQHRAWAYYIQHNHNNNHHTDPIAEIPEGEITQSTTGTVRRGSHDRHAAPEGTEAGGPSVGF